MATKRYATPEAQLLLHAVYDADAPDTAREALLHLLHCLADEMGSGEPASRQGWDKLADALDTGAEKVRVVRMEWER